MAWNQSTTNSENQNKEIEIVKKSESKRPKCVSFALWWYIVWGILLLGCPILNYLYASRPWTECATDCIIGLLLLDCARMISKRNMTAVLLSALALFVSLWITWAFVPAIIYALLPMAFLLFPHSIRWLKLNDRFSVSVLLASIVMVSVSCRLCFMSVITDTAISNANPLFVAVPGDKANHELNGDYQHVYCCKQHRRRIGNFTAQYNQNGKCCYVKLYGSGTPFWENITSFCNERFDNRIQWSDAVTVKGRDTEEGLPMLCGTVDKKLIMIFPNDGNSFFGTLLVCDSQLDSELDFLFALPDENEAMALLNSFLDNRDRILSVELDADDNQRNMRNDMYEGLKELRDQAAMLEFLALAIKPPIGEIKDLRVAKTLESFELRRKTMHELACGIWWTANMAVTAIEYNTRAIAMRRDERIKLRREYLEKDSPVPEELLPMDPTDHSGQNRIFDKFAKQFIEGRAELYWELHRKTGYNLGRPYNPDLEDRGCRQPPAAQGQSIYKKDEASDSIYNNPLIRDYGNPDRAKLFSAPFRNGLGMY